MGQGKRDEGRLRVRGRIGAPFREEKVPAEPQPWGNRKSDGSRTSDPGPVRERVLLKAGGRVSFRVMEREVSAVPALQQDLPQAAQQREQAAAGPQQRQSRGGRRPGENRPRGPGQTAAAAEVIREAKGHGMGRGKRDNVRFPGRVQTGVPTQARVQHAGTDRDPEDRGRAPARGVQDVRPENRRKFTAKTQRTLRKAKDFSH